VSPRRKTACTLRRPDTVPQPMVRTSWMPGKTPMRREQFTDKLVRMIQTIQSGALPARVREFYVFGTYSRGALHPGDLDVVVVHDDPGQPLASGGLATAEGPTEHLRAVADRHPRTALARPSSYGGHPTGIPGAVQVVSGSSGRPFLYRMPLCLTQSAPRELGGAGGRLALVEFVAPLPRHSRALAQRLATGRARTLAGVRQRSRDGKPVGGPAALGRARRPYGDSMWQQQTAAALGLESSLRKPGRPSKAKLTSVQNLT